MDLPAFLPLADQTAKCHFLLVKVWKYLHHLKVIIAGLLDY
jgi:hypothetical protein